MLPTADVMLPVAKEDPAAAPALLINERSISIGRATKTIMVKEFKKCR